MGSGLSQSFRYAVHDGGLAEENFLVLGLTTTRRLPRQNLLLQLTIYLLSEG